MLKPTNDALEVVKRGLAETGRAVRDSARAAGTQTYQAVRKIQAQVDQIRELVVRMPQNVGRQTEITSWTPGAGWRTLITTTIPRPADKTRVVVSANGSARAIAFSDVLPFQVRLIVNGVAGPAIDGMQFGSDFVKTCSAQTAFVREISGLAGSVTVQLQISLGAEYTSNQQATLSILAGFSTI